MIDTYDIRANPPQGASALSWSKKEWTSMTTRDKTKTRMVCKCHQPTKLMSWLLADKSILQGPSKATEGNAASTKNLGP